jgi:hypothetical protein
MLNQSELKTLVPSLVMSGVLLYEAITGNAVSDHVQGELVNGILIGAGYMVTLWGIWKNHHVRSVGLTAEQAKNEVTPKTIPPDQSGVQIPTLLHQTTGVNTQISPIVTQEDLNKKIGG